MDNSSDQPILPGLLGVNSMQTSENQMNSSNAWRIPLQLNLNSNPFKSVTSLFSSSLPVSPHKNLTFPDSGTGTPLNDENTPTELKDDLGINYFLPDEEELFSGILDDLDPPEIQELEEYDDVFGTGGGIELDESGELNPLEGFTVGFARTNLSDLGFNSAGNSQFGIGNSSGVNVSVAGDLPFGEHPSRTLFVRNINSNVEDSELKSMFEQYGAIRTLYTATKHRGFVMISYYDIRDAKNAMRGLQNKPLRRRKLDIHFSIPKDNPSDKDLNQGTLVIFNLDPSVSNEELRLIFGSYGEVKEIRETPHKRHHKYIEFYDVRAADAALRALKKSEIAGKRIKLEPSRPGGARRNAIENATTTGGLTGPQFLWGSPKPYSDQSSSWQSPPAVNSSFLSSNHNPPHGFLYGRQTAHQHHVGSAPSGLPFKTHSGFFPESPTSNFINKNNINNINNMSSFNMLSNNLSKLRMTTQQRMMSNNLNSNWMGSSSSLSNSPYGGYLGYLAGFEAMVNNRIFGQSQSQVESRKLYQLDLDKIVSGDDSRTTLMIKNIPNKYTSKLLLAAIDEKHKGTYDFFYLPIDFKNKCNVGYAFINMWNPSHIISFYETFNGKKWEKFNSEKVASLAYARIQGRTALISHFQNSSLMNEDKRCSPILFHSDGPEAGNRKPFPLDGVSSISLHDDAALEVNKMLIEDPSKILGRESLMYGRENEKKSIIQLLLSDDHNNHNVTVVCVVGPNGIGKTTMVEYIYTEKRVEDAFDIRVFISIYEEKIDRKRLMKEMLESLTCSPCDITEPSILEELLKYELLGKKLLLILDGVESESIDFWASLLLLLNVAAKGSAVLVTACRAEVADITGAMQCCKLEYLTDHYCWLIFHQLVFSVSDLHSSPELLKIGRRLITKCGHNILCVKMLGALLSRLVTEQDWRSVLDQLESDLWDMDKLGKEMSLYRVCYEHLPSHLKRCVTYSSLFPKGYIFSKHHLIRLWLSQGFHEPTDGRDLEDIGLEYLEDLCSLYFFHHSPLHDDKEDKFTMHERLHDLAQYVSRIEFLRSENSGHIISKDVHHFSLVLAEYQDVTLNLIIEEATKLDSFLIINRSKFQQDIAPTPVLNLKGLDDLFVKFNSLRTLDLTNTDIEELPISIKVLRNLFYLGLSQTNIKCIPSEISDLINLQTLEAKGCYNLVELPASIQSLSNLRHLDVKKEADFVSMPVGMGRLTSLHSLAVFNVGSDETHCGIEELNQLQNLKGSLQVSGLEHVGTGLDAKEANLKSKIFLKNLSLIWSESTGFIEDYGDMELQENVLENLEPSENLQELIIRNYMGNKFPSWVGYPSFSRLTSIILDNCPNCSMLPALGELPSLKYLSMQRMYGVNAMDIYKFPSLEILNLWEMYGLVEWPEIRNGDFPSLRSLSIIKCPLLMEIPCFPSLVDLSLFYCSQLPKITNLSSLVSLKIEGLLKIKRLDLPQNLSALKKLEIGHCRELLSVQGLSKLASIEVLKIVQCPKLDVGVWRP